MSDKTVVSVTDEYPNAKFPLGNVVITPNAMVKVPSGEVRAAIQRHSRGDWGKVGDRDWLMNDDSVSADARIISAYDTEKGVRFWVITEGDRSFTTVLMP